MQKNAHHVGHASKKIYIKKVGFDSFNDIVFCIIGTINQSHQKNHNWDEVILKSRIPKPKSNSGYIISNDQSRLSLYVENTTNAQYKNYLENCLEIGYSQEVIGDNDEFIAFDQNGFKLIIDYYSETMSIDLEAPMEMSHFEWSKSDLAKLIPVPETTIGKVKSDTSSNLYVYVGNTSIGTYNTYVNTCMESGFTIDYSKSENNFYAYDPNHNHLAVKYEDNQVMSIHLTQSANSSTNTNNKNSAKLPHKPVSENSNDLINRMHPEFKDAMDSYEAFIDEYCQFMKKYAATSTPNEDLLTDYNSYIQKYTETMNAFKDWKNKEMNDIETAYYLEVQTRVTQKLLESSNTLNH